MDAFKRHKWKFAPRITTVSKLLDSDALFHPRCPEGTGKGVLRTRIPPGEREQLLSPPDEFTFNSEVNKPQLPETN